MNKTRALVTGASSGLGAEFARQLASQGHDLILVARRESVLQAQAESLREQFGVSIDVIVADLAEANAVEDIVAVVQARKLQVDFLVNNAGSAGPDLLRDSDWPAQRRYLELMMMSVAGLCQCFIRSMCDRGRGRIVNVASVVGAVSIPGDCSYGPSKAYVIALSKALAASLQGTDVKVLALCPGFTHTDFHVAPDLMRMKQATPKFIWYDADVVVKEALAALEKGRVVLYSGRIYRFLMPILRSRLGAFVASRMGVKRDY